MQEQQQNCPRLQISMLNSFLCFSNTYVNISRNLDFQQFSDGQITIPWHAPTLLFFHINELCNCFIQTGEYSIGCADNFHNPFFTFGSVLALWHCLTEARVFQLIFTVCVNFVDHVLCAANESSALWDCNSYYKYFWCTYMTISSISNTFKPSITASTLSEFTSVENVVNNRIFLDVFCKLRIK